MHLFHQFLFMKPHLPRLHPLPLFQITPRRINNRHIILFIPLDRIRFAELRAVCDEGSRDGVPGLPFFEAEVDVGRGEVGDVEPDVFGESEFDQVFVCKRRVSVASFGSSIASPVRMADGVV